MSPWVTMLSMTAEHLTDVHRQAIPLNHRRYLMQRAEPPMGWQIWMGYYIGTKPNFSCVQSAARLRDSALTVKSEEADLLNTHITSLSIGKLYFYVYSSTVSRLGSVSFNEEIRDRLKIIWPAR